jgi:AcrR family transcriptional regulator
MDQRPDIEKVNRKRSDSRSEQTRAKLLEIARELFNEKGTAAVSTNHIAEAAGISIGNLYYHFKNREAFVLGLFEANAEETKVAFTPDPSAALDLAALEKMVSANYRILWKYRFFYRELIALINRDPELSRQYREHREYGFQSFMGLLRAFAQFGVLRPIESTAEAHRLAVVVWMVSEFFIQFLESDFEAFPEDYVEQGAALLRQVLTLYMQEAMGRA